jgi:hypothetical protein
MDLIPNVMDMSICHCRPAPVTLQYHVCSVIYYARYMNWPRVIRTVVLGHIWLANGCDVLFKTLVKITWKWVIYYTADALQSLYR